MAEKHMLAADFGGSSGRVVKGNLTETGFLWKKYIVLQMNR